MNLKNYSTKYLCPFYMKILMTFFSAIEVISMFVSTLYRNDTQFNFFSYISTFNGAFIRYTMELLTISIIFIFIMAIWTNHLKTSAMLLLIEFICLQIVFNVGPGKNCYFIYDGSIVVIGVFCAIVLSFIISYILTFIMKSKKLPSERKAKSDTADELLKYKRLLDEGAITQEEYEEKKKQLL